MRGGLKYKMLMQEADDILLSSSEINETQKTQSKVEEVVETNEGMNGWRWLGKEGV